VAAECAKAHNSGTDLIVHALQPTKNGSTCKTRAPFGHDQLVKPSVRKEATRQNRAGWHDRKPGAKRAQNGGTVERGVNTPRLAHMQPARSCQRVRTAHAEDLARECPAQVAGQGKNLAVTRDAVVVTVSRCTYAPGPTSKHATTTTARATGRDVP